MFQTLQIIVPLLTVFGIGGILGAYFQSIFQHRKQVREKEHELKILRYKCILILMLTQLDPKTGLLHIHELRPDLQDLDDIKKELEVELLNGVLFASDEVMKSLGEFIHNPSYSSYIKTAASMRKDLWGKKTVIDENFLSTIFEKKIK